MDGASEWSHVVRGLVVHRDGSPVPNLAIDAYNRILGGEEFLAGDISRADGSFAIAYTPSGEAALSVFVRASSNDELIATSGIVINAGVDVELDLLIEDDRFRGPSEFAEAFAVLEPQLVGVDATALTATDVGWTVRSSELSRVQTTAYIATRNLSQRTGLSHEGLYGLCRMLGTALSVRLLGARRTRIVTALQTAAARNYVDVSISDNAETLAGQFRSKAAEYAGDANRAGSLATLLESASSATAAQRSDFATLYLNNDKPMREFWGDVRAQMGDPVAEDMQLTVQLAGFAQGHLPLVSKLRADGMTRASDVASRSVDDWLGLIRTIVDGSPVGVPDSVKGDTPEDAENNFADLLYRRSRLAFPTAVIRERLRTSSGVSSPVSAFLDLNPDFDLKRTNVDTAMATATVDPGWDLEQLKRDLSATQRVARIVPRETVDEAVGSVLESGYRSAFAIARTRKAAFMADTGSSLDADVASATYANARNQASRTFAAWTTLHPPAVGARHARARETRHPGHRSPHLGEPLRFVADVSVPTLPFGILPCRVLCRPLVVAHRARPRHGRERL